MKEKSRQNPKLNLKTAQMAQSRRSVFHFGLRFFMFGAQNCRLGQVSATAPLVLL
ncbi:hypothetical protein [Petrimonas sp.]|uniref:hypothetical protein n=1 Tax=Petrimonas sp. TaxID=2023866 RepID=UPI003F516C94